MSHSSVSSKRRKPKLLSALVICAAVFATVATFAQPGDRSTFREPGAGAPANFDIRTHKADPAWEDKADAADYLLKHGTQAERAADLAVSRVTGIARLERAFAGLRVEDSPALGVTELVTAAAPTFLTGPSGDRAGSLRDFLSAHAAAYGVTPAQVAGLELVADYMNPAGNMGYAEFEQRFHGIPVFQGLVRGGFTAKGELVRTTGALAPGVDEASLATRPSLNAAQAVSAAASLVGWTLPEDALVERPSAIEGHVQFAQTGIAGEPSAWLVYFPLGPGVVRLSWATQLLGDPDGYLTVLDAETGTMLFRKNLTNYQAQSATYNVYTSDSPAPSSPTTALPGANFQAPTVSRTNVTLIGNEAPYTFNNLGWITDGVNVTAGNNVEAGLDLVTPDGVEPGTIVTGSPTRSFIHSYNPAPGNPAPGDDPSTAGFRSGEVVNLFYWTNRFHDLTYVLGFNEVSRNFQNDNFGRGGVGADRVRAEGQDFSGTDNANFQTPADGTSGRMQMYIFTAGTAVNRSSGVDQDVIIHELTHGLSNRLHNNGSGLGGTMSGGMGEGWSDFYARALLSDASESVNGVYTTGGWVTYRIAGDSFTDNYYYGIRRFPYAVRTATGGPSNLPFNPLTFADIDPAQINLTDGAYPRGPIGSASAFQVHNVGEVWASALFEVRARFITRLGFATGNQRILQFVTDGMKLDPVNPTLLQGRDSIIAAAQAGGGTAADVADIWAGFAARGMGVLAQVVNASTGTVVENFLTPSDPLPSFSIDDVSLTEGNAGTTNFTFTVTRANPGSVESRVNWQTANGTATSSEVPVTAAGAITINDNAAATPYPATLNVAGLAGSTVSVGVRLNSVNHTFPGDMDVMLRGPGGQTVMLMSDAGGTNDLVNADITFRDGAPVLTTGVITSGETYAPTDLTPGESLPAPAPAAPYGTALSVFNGTNPNGAWQLYVADDAGADVGDIAGGFTLLITTTTMGDYQPGYGQLVFGPGVTTQTVTVLVNGETTAESNETFTVNLSNPVAAVIADAQGLGTILNDDGQVTTTIDANGGTLGAIPDGTSTTCPAYGAPRNVTFTVSGLFGNLLGVSVTTAVTHPFVGDVRTELIAPDGATHVLFSRTGATTAGGFGDSSDLVGPYTFADDAAGNWWTAATAAGAAVALPAGPYRTSQPGGAGSTGAVTLMNPAFSGVDPNGTWTLRFTDGCQQDTGTVTAASLSLTMAAGAPAPTTVNDAFSTSHATPLVVAAPGVLANDNSNGGGPSTAQLVGATANGVVALDANGSFTYTPNAGFVGLDSFTYQAVNSGGPGNAATVSLTVAAGVPTTVADNLSTTYPTALNVAAPGVLGNDAANGGGALSAVLVSNVSNGTLTLGANGSVSYTPNFGFAGTDSFTYRAQSAVGPGNVVTVTINVAEPTTVQAPYNLRVDSVVGNTVTLRWDALPIGPQASTFILEGGINPGDVLGSFPTGSRSPIYTFVAPTGSWSIRMHGQLGSDKSPASNEVALHVNVPVTPSAPRNLLGLVNGETLDLTWKNTFEGGPATGLFLDVEGTATVSLPMAATERFSFTPVPGGTYTFRVRQINAGGSSPASDPVTLSFPAACTGVPEVPANFLGYLVGTTAHVIWDPPASGPTPTAYVLDVSGAFVASFATSGRTLSGPVGSGTYNVRVQAVNACGPSAFTPAQAIVVP